MSGHARARIVCVAGALLAAAALASCTSGTTGAPSPSTGATPATPSPGPTPPATAATPSPGETIVASPTSVVVTAPAGGSLLVNGTYPRLKSRCVHPIQPALEGRYPGRLTASRASDGSITLTLTIPFEDYLRGIAEVPASWPTAALQAQAIAARSYALASTGWRGQPGETLRSPICATTSCQVFHGLPVTPNPDIQRWYRAVRSTAGDMLIYRGRPADTLYSSTSNGRTYGNDVIFHTAPLPYLRPVVERDDRVSPASHWTVPVPFADVRRLLGAAGDWPANLAVTGVSRHGPSIVISGKATSRTLSVPEFRYDLNSWGPCLAPDRYPAPSWKGTPLPATVPSAFFRVARRPQGIALVGGGSGHGVGMVQWGAYGKALRGLSASDILAFYYGGLRPRSFPEPATIRVQIADGLTSIIIDPSGPGGQLDGEPFTGRIKVAGGSTLRVIRQPG